MADRSHPVLGSPIETRSRFGPERDRLREALRGLDDAASWGLPTPCPGWSVHDLALHVLGDDLGRLARTRDRFTGTAISGEETFPEFIDRINEEWVVAARRMSPRLLLDALAWTGEQIAELWRQLPPDASGEPVSWAGPDPAPVWLDAARDFTEYWVHRQQIHEALGQRPQDDSAAVHTVIDTFMRGLPHTLQSARRPAGTTFSFVVAGPSGGTWTVERDRDRWRLTEPAASPHSVELDEALTWRLCVRMIEPHEAASHAGISGDRELASTALTILSIIRAD